jgi:YkoY family integral membrane protein
MPLQEAIPLVFMLIALEGILSADNAMVLAILVRPLPPELRKKALLYGIVGAYVLRGIALAFAAVILKFWWIQLIGAAYLLYLPAKHFLSKKHSVEVAATVAGAASAGFWKIVAMVELTDLAFAVDSVLVAVALGREPWVIYTGVFLGILLLRLAAGVFVGLLDKFPRFEHVAYIMVGWAGVKLLVEGWAHCMEEIGDPGYALHLKPPVFWTITITLLVVGSIWALMKRDDVGNDKDSIPLDDEIEDVVTAIEEPDPEEEKTKG